MVAGVKWAVDEGLLQQTVRVVTGGGGGGRMRQLPWFDPAIMWLQKPITFDLDVLANRLHWPVADVQYKLFRLKVCTDDGLPVMLGMAGHDAPSRVVFACVRTTG